MKSSPGRAIAAGMIGNVLEWYDFAIYGWRIPFILGIVVGFAGLLLRRHMADDAPPEHAARSPVTETLRDHWRLVARLAGMSVFNAVGFYVMFVYVASWVQTADGIAPAHALAINTLSMIALLPVLLASGWLSDRFGRKPVLIFATSLTIVVALPLFWTMYHPSPALILFGQIWFGVLIGLFGGTQPAVMVEASPARIRCTAVALGYNTALAVFGGLSPLVATWLVERTADELAPAYLIMAAAAVSLLAVWRMRETYRVPLT